MHFRHATCVSPSSCGARSVPYHHACNCFLGWKGANTPSATCDSPHATTLSLKCAFSLLLSFMWCFDVKQVCDALPALLSRSTT